ncbi:MAG: DUF5110 domain-containing protein, partial [Bacteroidales bacterium]
YATEKVADPIEIRVYTGADASFVLYEDENDTYNYEKGQYATIAMDWNEANKTLTLKDRKGDFPGMLKERTFRVVWVSAKNGIGIEPAKEAKEVKYSGQQVIVRK